MQNEDEFEQGSLFTDLSIAIVSKLDDLDVINVVQELLRGCTANGKAIDPNEYFSGQIDHFYLVIEFALKENFGDFFSKVLKAKGLEIHTLREMMTPTMTQQEDTAETSES